MVFTETTRERKQYLTLPAFELDALIFKTLILLFPQQNKKASFRRLLNTVFHVERFYNCKLMVKLFLAPLFGRRRSPQQSGANVYEAHNPSSSRSQFGGSQYGGTQVNLTHGRPCAIFGHKLLKKFNNSQMAIC